MKIKNFLGAVLTLGIMAAMSVAANAATQLKTGDFTITNSGKVRIPVYIESTDISNVGAVTFDFKYDKSKFTAISGSTVMTYINDDDEVKTLADPTVNANKYPDEDKAVVVWASTSYHFEDNRCQMFNITLTPATGVDTSKLTNKDFAIVNLQSLGYDDDNGKTTKADSSTFATYITYDVPKEVGEDWSYGYIHSLKAVIKEAGTENVLTTQDISNCIDTGDSYQFVVKLVPSTLQAKTVVDVEFVAATAKTDAADAETTDVTVNTVSNVAVEYLK